MSVPRFSVSLTAAVALWFGPLAVLGPAGSETAGGSESPAEASGDLPESADLVLRRLERSRSEAGAERVSRQRTRAQREPDHEVSVPFIGTVAAWEGLGHALDGVRIAIIDTGVDYFHALVGTASACGGWDMCRTSQSPGDWGLRHTPSQ